MKYDNLFKDRLLQAIDESDKSRKEICDYCGISKSSLSEYLSGKVQPRFDTLVKLSDCLQIDILWLYGLNTPPNYNKLNTEGQRRVKQYIEDIMLKYKKHP